MTNTYRKLEVWQKSILLVEEIYQMTRSFPDDERYGLASQIRRAAVSIPSNIAEGYGRVHRGDYVRSLSYARGSLAELQTQLIIAERLNYVTTTNARSTWLLSDSISRMLTRLIMRLSVIPDSDQARGPRPEAPRSGALRPPGDK